MTYVSVRLSRDQREPMSACGLAQLLVPTGDLEIFSLAKGERARQVDRVVGAQPMRFGALGGFSEQRVADRVHVETAPHSLQVVESFAQLPGCQSLALLHPRQRRGGLDVSDSGGAHSIGVFIGGQGLLGARLCYQQLDQRARIEVEAQRRPSET